MMVSSVHAAKHRAILGDVDEDQVELGSGQFFHPRGASPLPLALEVSVGCRVGVGSRETRFLAWRACRGWAATWVWR